MTVPRLLPVCGLFYVDPQILVGVVFILAQLEKLLF